MDLRPLLEQLHSSGTGDTAWRPRLFDLSLHRDHEELSQLLKSGQVLFCHDEIIEQLKDLVQTREPSLDLEEDEIKKRVEQHLGGTDPLEYGTWVYYPWSSRLVHVLPEKEYRELRSDRNRYKITSEEQDKLRGAKIGFVGLSVGQVIARTMALESVGGEFRLADMDILGLSNLNRLDAGVHNLGVNKAFIVARQILEIDPYFNLSLFPEGIAPENIDDFLLEGGKLDLLVEECDDLFVKVRIREKAREAGIPILMDTCDRGLIDVERFDLEPGRPLFHGLVGDLEAESLKGLGMQEKVPYVLRLAGEDKLSDRATASIIEIGQTLSSLPQLASAVILGAGKCTDAARRILLGEFNHSGRFYVDLEELVCDGASEELPEARPLEPECSPEAMDSPRIDPVGPATGALTHDEVNSIVGCGILAPSAGNCQPWRFVFQNGKLLCLRDPERSTSFLNFQHCATYLTFGAVVENTLLAAAEMGRDAEVRLLPEPANADLICEIAFSQARGSRGDSELFSQIAQRSTNRKIGERTPLDEQAKKVLFQAAAVHDADLQLIVDEEKLSEIGEILGAGDRLSFLSKVMHREMMSELRWTPEQVEETRDGVDVATMEFSASEVAAVRIISSWPAMKMIGKVGGGRALEKPSKKAVAAASAVGLVSIAGTGPESYFTGGRAMQRVWLAAAAQGLSFHPLAGICYLFARLARGGGEGFSKKEIRVLQDLRKRYLEVFNLPGERAELLLFRVSRTDPPTARSLRRKLEDVLTFE